MEWYMAVLKKYAVFTGRARRKEYWMFALINFLISFGLGLVGGMIGGSESGGGLGFLGGLYSLAVLVPSIAVGVRRLHDTDRSGWWMLIGFIPILGAIALLIFFVQEGKPGPNQFGDNPKGLLA